MLGGNSAMGWQPINTLSRLMQRKPEEVPSKGDFTDVFKHLLVIFNFRLFPGGRKSSLQKYPFIVRRYVLYDAR